MRDAHAQNFDFESGGGEYRLEPIRVGGTPSDFWMSRSLYPAKSLSIQPLQGSGNVVQSLSESSAVPVGDGLRPGDKTQVRGFGFSTEETDVRVFGVSLNPAIGGGFNFSVFPSFLWSEAKYRVGLPASLSDPMGVSGSLLMKPWSQSALEDRSLTPYSRFAITSQKITQASAGVRVGDNATIVAGMSLGEVEGPAGGLSARLGHALGSEWTFHFLGSDMEGPNKGMPAFPSPFKRVDEMRLVPLLQRDANGGHEKTTFFADFSKRHDTDSSDPTSDTKTQSMQLGLDHAFEVWNETRIGLGGRYIDFDKQGASIPRDWNVNAQVARTFALSPNRSVMLEPQVALAVVKGYGPSPAGGISLGFPDIGSVLRTTYFRKTPTLQARYYDIPGFFTADPNLDPETGIQAQWISRMEREELNLSFEAFAQKRWQTVQTIMTGPSTSTVANSGSAYLVALIPQVEFTPTGWVTLSYSGNVSRSFVQNTRQGASGIPSFIQMGTLSFQNPHHGPYLPPLWVFKVRMKGWGEQPAFDGSQIASSWNLITEAGLRLGGNYELNFRVENWLEKTITYQEGFPFSDRVFAGGFRALF